MTRNLAALVAVTMLALAPTAAAQEASKLDASEAGAFLGGWTGRSTLNPPRGRL